MSANSRMLNLLATPEKYKKIPELTSLVPIIILHTSCLFKSDELGVSPGADLCKDDFDRLRPPEGVYNGDSLEILGPLSDTDEAPLVPSCFEMLLHTIILKC